MHPIQHIVDYWRARWQHEPDDVTLELIMDLQDMMMARTTLVLSRSMRTIPIERKRTFDPPTNE